MILHKEDIINSIQYIMKLRGGEGEIDDIDHLGNRRVRTIEELAGEELRKGFLKLKRTVQERMSIMEKKAITPRSVINSKTISSAIDFFFGRGELSQVVDQTNPLAQLTHERRLSALGPGGLNRKRAGFEVRDVHISHYGRICPIETPEFAGSKLRWAVSHVAASSSLGSAIPSTVSCPAPQSTTSRPPSATVLTVSSARPAWSTSAPGPRVTARGVVRRVASMRSSPAPASMRTSGASAH